MRKTFKYKLYISKRNKHLHQQIDLAAQIYNHCIALHRRYYRVYKKSLNKYQLQKHLTKLKGRNEHWYGLGSQAIQDITDRIERGYTNFFDSLKGRSGRKVAPPSFKKRRKYRSFTLKQVGYDLLEGNQIKIGKKIYKYHKSRGIEGNIKTLTVKRDLLGDIYLYFSCESEDIQVERAMTGKRAGFDFGLKMFLTSSDDVEIQAPLFFKKGLTEIRKASREVSSKKKGSNNRKKSVLNLARVHKKIANQRNDYHFKLANALAKEYDFMFFEDLNMKGMQMLWGRKVSDLGFSNYLNIQEYCCSKSGSVICSVDRYFPSSKLCHVCLCKNETLELKTREWTCHNCDTAHSRDKNASKNILREGMSSLGLGVVRPALPAFSA